MATRLEQILEETRSRVAESERRVSLAALAEDAKSYTPRGFRRALLRAAEKGPAVIAELKKASPSKGVLRGSLHVARLAVQLEKAGASALSVLTEERHFHGSLLNLREASIASTLPCLRKDFIVDEYQLYEARAFGADAVLLIVAALSPEQLSNLHRRALALQLDVLVEVHDEVELETAVQAGAEIIGVNSRNLKNLQVDPMVHLRLAERLPKSALKIAESGISNGSEISELRAIGYQAFLIGESLMRADNPGTRLKELLAEATTSRRRENRSSPSLRSASSE